MEKSQKQIIDRFFNTTAKDDFCNDTSNVHLNRAAMGDNEHEYDTLDAFENPTTDIEDKVSCFSNINSQSITMFAHHNRGRS